MTNDIQKLLRDAEEAAKTKDIKTLKQIRSEVLAAEGQTAEGVMEYFDSNFPEGTFD